MARKTTNRKGNNIDVADASTSNPKSHQGAESRSVKLAKNEIRTGSQFTKLMGALITDVIQENITPRVLNAAVNAGRLMLKMAELNLKYGKTAKSKQRPIEDDGTGPVLNLITG